MECPDTLGTQKKFWIIPSLIKSASPPKQLKARTWWHARAYPARRRTKKMGAPQFQRTGASQHLKPPAFLDGSAVKRQSILPRRWLRLWTSPWGNNTAPHGEVGATALQQSPLLFAGQKNIRHTLK